jgi:hypothetical protein
MDFPMEDKQRQKTTPIIQSVIQLANIRVMDNILQHIVLVGPMDTQQLGTLTMVACLRHNPQTCPDGSQPDSNGNCPSTNSQPQFSSTTSLGDKVCRLVNSGQADALGTLLGPLHLLSGGSTVAILAAGHLYCALHGSNGGN